MLRPSCRSRLLPGLDQKRGIGDSRGAKRTKRKEEEGIEGGAGLDFENSLYLSNAPNSALNSTSESAAKDIHHTAAVRLLFAYVRVSSTAMLQHLLFLPHAFRGGHVTGGQICVPHTTLCTQTL